VYRWPGAAGSVDAEADRVGVSAGTGVPHPDRSDPRQTEDWPVGGSVDIWNFV